MEDIQCTDCGIVTEHCKCKNVLQYWELSRKCGIELLKIHDTVALINWDLDNDEEWVQIHVDEHGSFIQPHPHLKLYLNEEE